MLFRKYKQDEYCLDQEDDVIEKTKKELEEYKKRYEALKYNVETFVNPDVLDIKKVEIGTIFGDGNKDDLKKLILLNLDSIVDNLVYEVSLNYSYELGYKYNMCVIVKPEEKEE